MNTDGETAFYQKKLWRRLATARIMLILGWIAVMVSLPMYMITLEYLGSSSTYTTWTTITSPFFLLFTPIFLGWVAGTMACLLSHSAPRWVIWTCRIVTVGLFCEVLLPMAVLFLPMCPQPATPGVPVALGLPLFIVGSLLIGLPPWIISVPRRKSLSPSEGSAPNTGGG